MPLVAAPPPPPLPPARILVHADEFFLNGSRRAGPSGLWRLGLMNNGEDDHDLRVRRLSDGRTLASTTVLLPGRNGTVSVRLKPGRYVLFCGVADHEQRGMTWPLTVRRPVHRSTAP